MGDTPPTPDAVLRLLLFCTGGRAGCDYGQPALCCYGLVFYPAILRTSALHLALGVLLNANASGKLLIGSEKVPRGGWASRPSLSVASFALPFKSGAKPLLATIAHKGTHTAFYSLGGVRMPSSSSEGHKKTLRGEHRDS